MTRAAGLRALLLAAFALVLLALAPACGRKESIVAPRGNVPPVVTAMFPLPRSTGVVYDTPIYVQFDRALDRRTVDTTTVFLKVDTRRIPVGVEYLGVVNRIQVTPRSTLELNKTYTVELSPRLKTPEGDSLAAKVVWQFSTNSVRRLTYTSPPQGALEGPHAMLGWSGNGGPSNTYLYEVYASTDSAAVANRSVSPVQSAVYVNCLPRASWAAGARTFWAVTTVNLVTGERFLNPVASFDVYRADAPVDTVIIPLVDYGGAGSNNRTQFCATPTFTTGLAYNSGVRWNLSGDRPNLHVADAYMTIYANASSAATVASANTQLWYGQNSWSACAFTLNGVPFTETNGYLATATVAGLRAEWVSPGLSAFVEAGARFGGWNGFLFRGTGTVNWDVLTSGVPQPQLKVVYYR
ncbi:MAG: Ig-like domain-containing protein [Candidatus Eisenbacteria bacterium]|uniref:Ig-like domain-containing protein n=1 Tax=Eiseniibacteriota bacterium TaxID=2212470 RepID=A0A933W9I2_UNCEI|nr:Ig-like domain-containing protein [Candidatus Eisenbacteria bacterium]